MWIIVIEPARHNFNRDIVSIHSPQSHNTDSSLEWQKTKVVVAAAFRENAYAFAVIERFPNLLIELGELQLVYVFEGDVLSSELYDIFALDFSLNFRDDPCYF